MASGPPPPGPSDDPLLGRVLAGTYRVEERLGAGAMGTVYRAQHTLLGEPYAVKVLHPDLAGDDDVRRRFLQEARALTRFAHKNAVAVRHCGEEDGLVFLAMDLCRGRTLEELLAAEGPALPEPRALGLALQVLDVLGEAHAAGIIHRDLKPANVMVEAGEGGAERVRVLDFGLSRLLAEHRDAQSARISSLGEVVGTVAYMSPEQALGEDLDGRSDLFSLAVLLYEIVEGRHPLEGGPRHPRTMASRITRLLDVDRVLAAPAEPCRASPGLARVLARALARDPARRHPDAAAFAADLRALLAGHLPASAARDLLPAPARPARRGLLLLAGGLGLAALALALLLRPGGEASERATPGGEAAAARAALAAGRYAEALALLEPLVAGPAPDPELLRAAAEARVALRDPDADRALAALERALPDDARVEVLRGRYLHRVRGDPAQALRAFGQALRRDKDDPAAREARLDLLLDPAHSAYLDSRPESRLALAAADVEALARSASAPPGAAAVARARLRRAEALEAEQVGRGADAERLLGEAQAAAQAAETADPLWAQGPVERAEALFTRAGAARTGGRAEEALRLGQEALAALLEARRRVAAAPACRAQGAEAVPLLKRSLAFRVHAQDYTGLAEDARALGRVAPHDLGTIHEAALALRTAGAFEEALPLYEALRDAAPSESVLADLAFCQQRIAVGRLLAGEHAAGVQALREALAAYDAGLGLAPRSSGLLAYRGETQALIARYAPAEAADALERARADLEAAAALARPREGRREVLYRRAGLRLQTGDAEGAASDLREALGESRDLNPSFHGRYARALLALAVAAPDAAGVRARRDEALVQVDLARARSGTATGSALLLAAWVRLLAPAEGPSPEDLRAVARDVEAALPETFPPGDGPAERTLVAALARALEGTGPAREAALAVLGRRRAALREAGGDMLTRRFLAEAAPLLRALTPAPADSAGTGPAVPAPADALADALALLAAHAPP